MRSRAEAIQSLEAGKLGNDQKKTLMRVFAATLADWQCRDLT